MARSLIAVAVVAALVACSGNGGTSLAQGGEDPPPYFAVPDGVLCGAARCDPGAFCIGTEGENRCAPPGAEREAPLGALVMKCDGREDCEAGDQCMSVRGELTVFQCMDECDGLNFESVCTTDADCRRCEKLADQFEVRCRRHPIARHLSVCGWK